uniref:Serpentine Receptor, class T n=1 Tax=Steinernema glaseri TaxID=37863 RepID=A0A1I8AUV4_9BILA
MDMETLRLVVGILHVVIGVLLPPIYIRFIYIFLSRKKYRKLECYRIMAQIGIVQLFAGPGAIGNGIIQLLDYDPYEIFTFLVILYSASIATELFLSFVLAINRLKVIFELPTHAALHKILLVLSVVYGVVYCGLLVSPWCGYDMLPGQFVGKYNFSKPYTQLFADVNAIIFTSFSGLSFVVYLIIIMKLVWLRSRSATKHFKEERSMFIYAGIRFSIEITLNIVFFFVQLPPSPWTDLATGLTYILNSLLVSPVLYLILAKGLREDFMDVFSHGKKVKAITSIHSTLPRFDSRHHMHTTHR